MSSKERKILLIDFLRTAPPVEERFKFGNLDFTVQTHAIGWDFETAEELIRKSDDFMDGIALSGVRRTVGIGDENIHYGPTLKLIRAAKRSRLYLGDEVRHLFAEWTLKRVLRLDPNIFRGKRALFHCALATSFLNTIESGGASIEAADALVFAGVPLRLSGRKAMETFLKSMKVARLLLGNPRMDPRKAHHVGLPVFLEKWTKEADIFITYRALIDQIEDPSALRGKILLVDYLTDAQRTRLNDAGVGQIVEFVPRHASIEALRAHPIPLFTAVIDQMRLAEDSPLNFDDYTLKWIASLGIQPNRLRSPRDLPIRCGFIVHPLTQRQIWNVPGLRPVTQAPKWLRNGFERAMAHAPIIRYGQLTGAKSEKTGQEVICDIFGIAATPKMLLNLDEDFVYSRLVKAATLAHERGAVLFGLGAYTKIVGDAGVTVARRSPLPVTTGNSYSVATTLWAARVMIESLGMVGKLEKGKRIRGKAMVIGATGSIGRVAALLVSLIVDEIVLVGPRPDKLLEVREEILSHSPDIRVRMATNPNPGLPNADLIVTATSNQSGNILDITRVKPGAVICDCSRPLDISEEEAKSRPDVLIIESGEVDLPGHPDIDVDIGLPKPSVYACMAETVLLAMDHRFEPFSLGRDLSMERVKEIYKIGLKHGAKLSAIRGHEGVVTPQRISECRALAKERLRAWNIQAREESEILFQ